jgi:lytic murein transglycosylase
MFSLFLTIALALPAWAQDRQDIERQFQDWLEQTIWPEAKGTGVSRRTFDAAVGGVRLNWELPDLVVPGQKAQVPTAQRQAEFGAPGRYFRGVEGDAGLGRQMAQRHARALAEAERKTGVPGRIVLGIWGRESAYGRAKIPHNAIQVLATKGFMSTRAAYFTQELVAALQILERGYAPAGPLKSSWAGALGQPQFMPSNVLEHATDGDGDRRADIWTSEADTIASIATYLARHGWQAGRDWGFEVVVPDRVSCALEGPDQGRRIADWANAGIRRVSGKPFPDNEKNKTGFLMMPAGRYGPAFIVTPNFYVLKDYNMSDLYALYVGHVGDRIAYGMGDFEGRWRDPGRLMRSDIARMQQALEGLGHDVGGVDGLPGFKTRRSIGRWQEATGRSATCFPDRGVIDALAR